MMDEFNKLEYFTDTFVCDPQIMEIVQKIKLTATFPPDKPLGAGVTIKMKSGEEFERRIDTPKGNGTLTPLSASELRAKFFDNVTFSNTIPINKAEQALSLLENLEQVDHLGRLINTLVR